MTTWKPGPGSIPCWYVTHLEEGSLLRHADPYGEEAWRWFPGAGWWDNPLAGEDIDEARAARFVELELRRRIMDRAIRALSRDEAVGIAAALGLWR